MWWNFLAAALTGFGMMTGTAKEDDHFLLFDFSQEGHRGSWRIVNDGVMGGVSQSSMTLQDGKIARFAGILSLENNGGFASVRSVPGHVDLSGYGAIQARVLGDGQRYRFRIRCDGRWDGVAYDAPFDTTAGEWQTITIPWDAFEPRFRGRLAEQAGPMAPGRVEQVGFLIADKQAGPFRLDIAWIRAVPSEEEGEEALN